MRRPTITELCTGEIDDFLYELVQKDLQNIPPDMHCRRRELCEALLACNKEEGERRKMREDMTKILRSWNASPGQIRKLEQLGFHVTTGRTHMKLRWKGSEYYATLAATPSCHRNGINAARNAVAAFF